jgi:lipopolysaccharide biosynthesis glycosyltransferase
MANNESTLAIVTAADENYAIPLAVLLKSIELNLKTCIPAAVYVIDTGLRGKTRRMIQRDIREDRVKLEWITAKNDQRLSEVPVFGHVNLSTYYRVLVPELLFDLKRVIYLDADMLVLGDLGELWKISMQGKPLMAVQEIGNASISSARIPGYRELKLPPDAKAFNGGMLVMDAEQWRKERLPERILSYLRTYAAEVRYWDQDGLNALLCDRWLELPRIWNWRIDSSHCDNGIIGGNFGANVGARILHFSSATKPWHYYCDQKAKDIFFQYLKKTPYCQWRPRPPLKALLNRHYWGAALRRLPGLSRIFKFCRSKWRNA